MIKLITVMCETVTFITALEPHSVQEKKLNESFFLALDLIFKIIISSSQKMLISELGVRL